MIHETIVVIRSHVSVPSVTNQKQRSLRFGSQSAFGYSKKKLRNAKHFVMPMADEAETMLWFVICRKTLIRRR